MAETITSPDVPIVSQNSFVCYSRLRRDGQTLIVPSEIPCSCSPSFSCVTGIASASGGLNNEYISITPKVEGGALSWEIIGREQLASGAWSFECTVSTNGNSELSAATVKFTFQVRLRPADDVHGGARFFLEEGETLAFTSVLPSANNPMIDYGASQEGDLRSWYEGSWESYTDDSGIPRSRWVGEPSGLLVRFERDIRGTVTDIKIGGTAGRPGLYFFWVYRNNWSEGGQYDYLPQSFPPGSNAVPVFVEIHKPGVLPNGSLAIRTAQGAVVPYTPPESEEYRDVHWNGQTASVIVRDPALRFGNTAANVAADSTLRLNGYGIWGYYPAFRYYVPFNGAGGGLAPDASVSFSIEQRKTEKSSWNGVWQAMDTSSEEVNSETRMTFSGTIPLGKLQQRNGPEVMFWESACEEAEYDYVSEHERSGVNFGNSPFQELNSVNISGDPKTYGFARVYPMSFRSEECHNGIFAAAHVRASVEAPAIRKSYLEEDGQVKVDTEEEITISAGVDGQSAQLYHLIGALLVGEGEAPPGLDGYEEGTIQFSRGGGYTDWISTGSEYVEWKATWKGRTGNAVTTIYNEDGTSEVVDDPLREVFNAYVADARSGKIPQPGPDAFYDSDEYETYTEDLYVKQISMGQS